MQEYVKKAPPRAREREREVDAAYYSAPPGWIGQEIPVQWDHRQVRLLHPQTGELLSNRPVEDWGKLLGAGARAPPGRRRMEVFEEAMAQMAADPAIRSECIDIASECAAADFDPVRPSRFL